nr:retrovirus-related Pol polyprotein from transposon TNT 1-94 [Tanacetum cinerariifolium]
MERIPNTSYFHMFGYPVFIHNHNDHHGIFDAKADDGYFLGYSSISKAFRVYNTIRQQIEETYHETFDEIRIACYNQSTLIIVKRHDKTPYEISMEIIPNTSYFHMFGYPVFIHNHNDHHGIFDAKADDGYFLGYSSISKAFRVYNTIRQQIEETYHETFDESMEAI